MMSGREHSRLSCLVGKMQVMATDIIAMDGDVCRMNGIKLQFEYNVCIKLIEKVLDEKIGNIL